MQRKFLEELGLEKDAIDKIMTENGNDINAARQKLEAERDNYKQQLETATATLKTFEGVDVNDLQSKITALQNDLTAKDAEYQQKIADRDFSDKLNGLITTAGGKNSKAIMALLDVDTIKASKNQDTDLQAAIDKCKAENDYLFESTEPISRKKTVGSTGTPPATKMTLSEAMAYVNAHPDADVATLI